MIKKIRECCLWVLLLTVVLPEEEKNGKEGGDTLPYWTLQKTLHCPRNKEHGKERQEVEEDS